MSSLAAKDRASLCSFTFADGRRCRTPRTGKNPNFCFYHAQKEAQALAAEKLGKDLDYFFSGNYLSACDLSTALSRLIPAVVRGDVKSKTARTVAYLLQTLMQSIHISQHEYISAFGADGWRKSVRNSVNGNRDYFFPPAPEPQQAQSPQPQPQPAGIPAGCHSERSEESAFSSFPTPSPTSAQAPQPVSATPSNPPHPPATLTPAPVAHPFRGEALRSASSPQIAATPNHPGNATPHQPAGIPAGCHSERSEEPAFSSSLTPSPDPAPAPQTPKPSPTIELVRPVASAPPPNNPVRSAPSAPQPTHSSPARALHFDHTCRLLIDGKPL
jgi:hypothetical protein